MADPKVENLSEKERTYLEHLQQAQKLGVSFAQYCRQKGLASKTVVLGQTWIGPQGSDCRAAPGASREAQGICTGAHRALSNSGMSDDSSPGWIIECGSLPQVQ